MSIKPTTIDDLGLDIHERYALDQATVDRTFTTTPSVIFPNAEGGGLNSIFISKQELLFEAHIKNASWALFSPPPVAQMPRHLFAIYLLAPNVPMQDIEWFKERPKRDSLRALLKKRRKTGTGEINLSDIEFPEETTILDMMDSLFHLEKLQNIIGTKRQQYRRG